MKTEFKPSIPEPGSITWPFRLGDEVRDKISGVSGTLIARFFHATGCDRFAIELPSPGDKLGEIVHMDGNRIELVKARPELHREEVPTDLHVKLGDKVQSLLSGLPGNATIIHVPLYGAVQVCIDPMWDPKEKKMPEAFFVDAPFVKVIEPYTPLPAGEPAPTPSEKTTKQRGASRMPSNFQPR